MDAKITKKRIGRLLSYDWIKIVALAAAAIVLWSLIFTMTATRITPAQQFTVFNYYCNAPLSQKFYDNYQSALSKGAFSYEVIETNVNDLTTGGKDYYLTLIEARFSTDEGDILFVPDIPDPDSKTTAEDGTESYAYTYSEAFFNRFYMNIYDIDAYLGGMAEYLNGFYGDYKTGTLDTQKAEADFVARITRNKDKRFKTDEAITQGKKDAVARLEKYRDALVKLSAYLESGVIALENRTLKGENGNNILDGNYALNICPDEAQMGELKNYIAYREELEDGVRATAKDMQVYFLKMPGVEESFQYESVCYLVQLLDASRTPDA
ncbi:MAG: hypothetical protein IJB34_02470 [Clostridia bacterium]|nr:hypothetical protein [Clostridia bacterium]